MTASPLIWRALIALVFIRSALAFLTSARPSNSARYRTISPHIRLHSTTRTVTRIYSSVDDDIPNPIEEFEKDLARFKGEIDDTLKTGQEVVRGIQETPGKLASETGKMVDEVSQVPLKTKKAIDDTVKTTTEIVDGIVSAPGKALEAIDSTVKTTTDIVDTIAAAPTNIANTVDTTVRATTDIVESIKEVPVQTKRVMDVLQKTPSTISTQATETMQSIQEVPTNMKGVYDDVTKDIQAFFATISKYPDKLMEWWKVVQKSPEKIKKKAKEVQADAESTAKAIQEVPKSARSTFKSVRKGVIEVYNAPGQALEKTKTTITAIQSTTQSVQKRSKLVSDQGLSALFAPLDSTANTNSTSLPKVTLSKEQLKGGVSAIFDLGEQAVLKAIEIAEKSPEYIKQIEEIPDRIEVLKKEQISYFDEIQKEVDSSVADIKSIPQKVDGTKTKATKRLQESREKAKTLQRQVQDVGQGVWNWVSLKEPKRIVGEVVTSLTETKENLDALQKSLAEDVVVAKSFVEESTEAVKKLPSEMQSTTENLKSTYDSIFKDANYITKSMGKAVNTLDERLVSKDEKSKSDKNSKSTSDINSLFSKPAAKTTKPPVKTAVPPTKKNPSKPK